MSLRGTATLYVQAKRSVEEARQDALSGVRALADKEGKAGKPKVIREGSTKSGGKSYHWAEAECEFQA